MSLHAPNGTENDTNNNSSSASNPISASKSRWPGLQTSEQESRHIPKFVFDPDSCLVFYWSAAVALATLYNAWTIALRISFPEIRQERGLFYLYYVDMLSDFIYLMDILMQLRTAYLQDGIPVFEPSKIRKQYLSQKYFVQDVISVIPSQTILSLLPDAVGWCKYFLLTAGAARLTKLLKFHILYRFYDLAESFTSNPHLIRVLRLFLNLAIIIHWIACLYYLLSEYEGLGSNQWVYTNATDQQRFSRKYIICLYWSAMTLTTIGNTNSPETDVEYIFTGVIFLTGVFVFATVMGNVGDVISSMNANRQEFQARMDHIQMYLTHKKVPASLQLKIKKWAEYTWSRTKATDESRLLNMLPERLRAEVAVHVHLDSLKKVKIFEQCETGFLCELVLKLRSQVFSPGDYVCRAGETGREMFIINHGKVEVLVPSPATNKDMVVAVLSEGNYFGEISLLRLDGVQNRRTADVRSIGYSELLCLSRRDLMAALVEYPEAKSILEGQAKKRMKTNLQAQRAFSVDTLMKSSQDYSSFDSGISSKDERGHDVSEIKAMIEELKNASKVPGRTIWQLIARCEVLQAKLGEKEKEIEDSKQRIKDLEQLLFAGHLPKASAPPEPQPDESTSGNGKSSRGGIKVTKQYSQDEGRPVFKDSPLSYCSQKDSAPTRVIPDLRITRASETSDDESESSPSHLTDDGCIKTSKITSVSCGKPRIDRNPVSDPRDLQTEPDRSRNLITSVVHGPNHTHQKVQRQFGTDDGFKSYSQNIRSSHSAEGGHFSTQTSVDRQIFFNNYDEISVTTSFKDELYLNDAFNLDVHTIPEENEEELESSFRPSTSAEYHPYHNVDRDISPNAEALSPNSIYRDLDPSDQEVKPVRSRIGRSASTSSGLCKGKRSRSNILDMKKLYSSLDGVTLDPYDSDSGINFLRLGSVDSSFSDETSSRRNSYNWDSELEGDSEESALSS